MSEIIENTVTTTEVNDKAPELNMEYVARKIAIMNPYATPLLTLLSGKRSSKTGAIKTSFYDVDVEVLEDAVADDYINTGDGDLIADITVGNISIWAVGDTALFVEIAGGDSKPFAALVIEVSKAENTISVKPLNGIAGSGTTADEIIVPKSIPADTNVLKMGNASTELAFGLSPIITSVPGKDFNYCQSFMAQVEESTFQSMHKQETEWGMTEMQKTKLLNMKARMEYSYLFGYRGLSLDDEGRERYTANGIVRYFDNNFTYSTIDDAVFAGWMERIFAEKGSSDEKFMFAGNNVIKSLMALGLFKGGSGRNIVNKDGVNFYKVESPFGALYVRSHPMLRVGSLKDSVLTVDIANIYEKEFVGLTITELDLKKAGVSNVKSRVLQKVSCPIVRYAKTHSFITKV